MKVTIDSKKGLKTNLRVFIDKKTIEEKIATRLSELSKTVNLKGFRPGRVPVNVLKRQFGKAVYDEVLEKILKEVFQAEKIDLNFSMDEIPEWDSFKHYELIIAIENEFKIKLEDADTIEITSIPIIKSKILKYLNEK